MAAALAPALDPEAKMSNQATDIKNEAFRLAERGQHLKALKLIGGYKAQSLVEERILAHSQAEVAMIQGNMQQALDLLLAAKEKYGEHVALLTDIAICYYSLNEFKKWKFAFADLKKAYAEHKDFLIFERRAMAELNLAKFYEEDGEVAIAAQMYMTLIRQMEERQDIARFYRIMSQALRVMSTFHMSGNLANTYQLMITIGKAQINLYASIDVQHALLLSELALTGPQNAAARLLEVLRTDKVSLYDKQLIYFDFLEESLLQGFPVSEKLIPFASLFKELNGFEKEVFKLAIKKDYAVDFENLIQLSQTLPLSCYIRVLGAYIAKTKDEATAVELRNQMKLVTSSLSAESQNHWINRYQKLLKVSAATVLNYNTDAKLLTFGNKAETLARREAFGVLIELLSRSPEVDTEKAIACIWNVSFDPTYYKSLRMTVLRLNKLIFAMIGVPKVLEINKTKITLTGGIQFNLCTSVPR